MRYPKKYTVKEWKRFSWTMQEKLCERYIVILTDHKTKSLKDMISPKNINQKLDATVKILDKISRTLNSFDGSKIKMFKGVSQREYDDLLGDKKQDYSALKGKRDYKFLTG